MAYTNLIIVKELDSTVPGGKFEISSYSWGVTQAGGYSYGSGGMSGKVQIHDLSVTFPRNDASPKLMEYCATGKHLDKVLILAVTKGSGDINKPSMKIELTDVIVSSYQTGGSGDDKPIDAMGLNYAKSAIAYDASGTP